MQGDGNYAAKLPTQRLVFLVKHLMKCLQSEDISLKLMTEIFKVLTTVFPQIKEIYGFHWSDAFAALKSLWQSRKGSDEYLPALHSSLRLFSCLRGLAMSECNDDLEDAWDAVKKEHAEILIGLLSEFGELIVQQCPMTIRANYVVRSFVLP